MDSASRRQGDQSHYQHSQSECPLSFATLQSGPTLAYKRSSRSAWDCVTGAAFHLTAASTVEIIISFINQVESGHGEAPEPALPTTTTSGGICQSSETVAALRKLK